MTIGERNKIIIAMRKDGHKYSDIIKRLGCDKHLVANIVYFYKHGGEAAIDSKRTLFKDKEARDEEVMRMFAEGMTMTDIAKEIGMSISSVSRIISKDKIKEEKAEPEPVVKPMVIVRVGDTVMFSRDHEQVIGHVESLNRHTVTITVDHGRYQETCCPNYSEIEAVL